MRRALAVPLSVFAIAELAMLLIALGSGHPPLDDATWTHADSGLYLQIASRGYELMPCVGIPPYTPADSCGTAAWFPLFPWLVAGLHVLGVPFGVAGLLIARAFALGTLVVVWNGLLDREATPPKLAALVLAAFFPGAVYFHAVFPMSMATFGIAVALVLVRRERWRSLAAAAALTAMTYPVAVLLGPVIAAWALIRRRRAGAAPAGWAVAGSVAGGLTVLVVQRLQTGAWDAFAKVQEKYDYQPEAPPVALWHRVEGLLHGDLGDRGLAAAQAALVAALVIGLVAWALRRRDRDGLAILVALQLAVFWLFPLTLGQLSLYRSDTLLLPAAVLVARLPASVAVAIAGVAVTVAMALAIPFVDGTLV